MRALKEWHLDDARPVHEQAHPAQVSSGSPQLLQRMHMERRVDSGWLVVALTQPCVT